MKTSDVSDREVLRAYVQAISEQFERYPYEILMARHPGLPQKVAYAAMERSHRRGLVSFGTSLRTGWLTNKGVSLLTGEPEE